ncbi:MAG: hypothetical protein Q8Q09_02925 [Deltaproteobacteria bacterium]|nr:hypothetical protein [Deltaproteobacteria bacterium]
MTHAARPKLALLAVAALVSSSCLYRPVPIPPPMASVQGLTDCAPTDQCPADGVIVDFEGFAVPGALVLIENTTRTLPSGGSYAVSTFARRSETEAGVSDASVGDGGVLSRGSFYARLGPIRDVAGGTVTISQRGDSFIIRQLIPDSQGNYAVSDWVTLRVPPR